MILQRNQRHRSSRSKRKTRSPVKELLLMLILDWTGPLGRYRLKNMLGLSEHEGIVRYTLSDLQQQGLISATKSGSHLTSKGKTVLMELLKTHNIIAIKPFQSPALNTGPNSVGMHLHQVRDNIKSAMELRDIAIRGGATRATIIISKDDELSIPSIEPNFLLKNPDLVTQIQDAFHLKDKDVLIITSAQNKWRALEAAIIIVKIMEL